MTAFLLNPHRFGAAFSPDSLSGLEVWLKADAIGGLSDADPVTTWTDSSSGGNDATQSTSAKKPTYRTNVVNGLPVVRFDGTDDGMNVADSADYKTANITVFLVAKSASRGRVLVCYPHNTTHTDPYFRWTFFHNSAADTLNTRWNGVDQGSVGTITPAAFQVFELVDADTYIDGTLADDNTDADLTYPNAVGLRLGYNASQGECLNGDIAEFLLYSRSLNSTERGQVRSYLGTKYGITVA